MRLSIKQAIGVILLQHGAIPQASRWTENPNIEKNDDYSAGTATDPGSLSDHCLPPDDLQHHPTLALRRPTLDLAVHRNGLRLAPQIITPERKSNGSLHTPMPYRLFRVSSQNGVQFTPPSVSSHLRARLRKGFCDRCVCDSRLGCGPMKHAAGWRTLSDARSVTRPI